MLPVCADPVAIGGQPLAFPAGSKVLSLVFQQAQMGNIACSKPDILSLFHKN
jgi:hypothetical protein